MKQQFHDYKRTPSRATKIARLVFAIALAILPASPAGISSRDAAAQKSGSVPGATLVCVVSREDSSDASASGNMDAVVLVVNGKLRQPYNEEDQAAWDTFAQKYLLRKRNIASHLAADRSRF
jgi:hypothetical protein